MLPAPLDVYKRQYHRMAKACGIDMMECRLLQEKESYHFMTRRFDRMEDGEKIHVPVSYTHLCNTTNPIYGFPFFFSL